MVQIYWHKRNFDTQKAERWFKERRIPYQSMDLKKHRLGEKEVALFARTLTARGLLDLEDIKVKSHPAAYTNQPDNILGYILEDPRLLRSPIIRNGSKVMAGFDETLLQELLQ